MSVFFCRNRNSRLTAASVSYKVAPYFERRIIMKATNSATFDVDILGPTTLVEIWSPGCGPCKIMQEDVLPFVESDMNVKVLTLNIAENTDLIPKIQSEAGTIMSVPILLFYVGGKFAGRKDGLLSCDEIEDCLEDMS